MLKTLNSNVSFEYLEELQINLKVVSGSTRKEITIADLMAYIEKLNIIPKSEYFHKEIKGTKTKGDYLVVTLGSDKYTIDLTAAELIFDGYYYSYKSGNWSLQITAKAKKNNEAYQTSKFVYRAQDAADWTRLLTSNDAVSSQKDLDALKKIATTTQSDVASLQNVVIDLRNKVNEIGSASHDCKCEYGYDPYYGGDDVYQVSDSTLLSRIENLEYQVKTLSSKLSEKEGDIDILKGLVTILDSRVSALENKADDPYQYGAGSYGDYELLPKNSILEVLLTR